MVYVDPSGTPAALSLNGAAAAPGGKPAAKSSGGGLATGWIIVIIVGGLALLGVAGFALTRGRAAG